MYIGNYIHGEFLRLNVVTRNALGQAVDADANPSYRIYWAGEGTATATGSLVLSDSGNTDGNYVASAQLNNTTYVNTGVYRVYIEATIDGITTTTLRYFQLLGGPLQPTITGEVDDTGFTPTTTEFETSNIVEATADHFNDRVVIFTAGALKNQAKDITDYSLSGGRGHFTVSALTEAPSDGDRFIIV